MDFKTLLRTGKPNDYLVADADCLSAKPDRPALSVPKPAPEVAAAIIAMATAMPRVKLEYHDQNEHGLQFSEKSKLLGFVDDIFLKIVPGNDLTSCRVLYYSKSRVGYSDMGVNRRRGELWLKTVQAKFS
ncbi:MAG: DUF1499 domain-containing protein [Parvularculaceae bacterium]